MSEVTAVCPWCGHRNRVESRYLTPRYEIPCQGKWCGNIFTPNGQPDDNWQHHLAVARGVLNRCTGLGKALAIPQEEK